jgi:hypothetical protein
MRKILALAALGVLISSGMARAGDPDIGCGWGSKAFKGQSGVVPKVMAATTNSSFTQTFGISSGTAGCTQGGTVRAEVRLDMYAGANIDALASDMAAGRGESLDTLAELLGIEDADRAAFGHLVKANFAVLFPSDDVTAGRMLAALKTLMASDDQLAKYVS